MSIHLGRLKKVDLREFFKDEARDFTPWLAQEENLELLGETLGIDIELEDTEVRIGKFSADIVGLDRSSNRVIIIENQLEKTNHDHLGKIITYGAGKDAGIVIWICKKIQQEHRKGLDYLNDMSTEDYSFFGIEMELWKIGESEPAPKFNIVVSPNEWSKAVKSSTSQTLTSTQILQREFWTELKEYFTDNNTFLSMRTPRPQHWYSIAVGTSYFGIGLIIDTQKNIIRCDFTFWGEDVKNNYSSILLDKDEIDNEFSNPLIWREMEGKKTSKISLSNNVNGNIKDRKNWEDCFVWFKETAETFHKVFSPRVKQL